MSETETQVEPKAEKAAEKAKTNKVDEAALAMFLYQSIPAQERKHALIEAQMANLGRRAFAILADGYKKLTGNPLTPFIILDGESGVFGDPDDFDDIDEDDEEDEEEDETDATSGEDEDEDEEEPTYTASQAVRMLRKWMKENDYTQAFVAKRLKVTQPAVSTWLAKTSYPREVSIQRIVKLCSK